MLVLDTDHLRDIIEGTDLGGMLLERLRRAMIDREEEVVTTIISVEETLRGWLSQIRRHTRDPDRQVEYYVRLQALISFYQKWTILPFDSIAAQRFTNLQRQGLRHHPYDIRIAAIALCNQATVLTANVNHFRQVPDLQVEDWLEPPA